MALQSTAEAPLPLRTVSRAVADWIGRLGRVWVEGQVTQISLRPGQRVAFLTLRDIAADISMQVTATRALVENLPAPLTEGAQIVAWVQPELWAGRGTLRLVAHEIRPVGVGALLARIEALKVVLAAEGLFAAGRKQPLPFLPGAIGLITGRASAAERDVVQTALHRWPAARFAVRTVAVQGPGSVVAILGALRELDADPSVEVIVLARGGGSVEDLLPFSDEALCRAVAACRTPCVSAIGHEPDTPLLDFVADVRASTPTDAGKRVVPDVAEERARIAAARQLLRRGMAHRVTAERERCARAQQRTRQLAAHRADAGRRETAQLAARVRALSPAATLERGYAVVLHDGVAVRRASAVTADDQLVVHVADGTFQAIASATGRKPNGALPSR